MLSNVFTHSFNPYGIKSFKLILNSYLMTFWMIFLLASLMVAMSNDCK